MSKAKEAGRELAVCYCRVSSPGQASIPDQEKWARRHADEKGWLLLASIKDEGVKGNTLSRPGLTELEELFARQHRAGKPIARLIVWATDRLSRADTLDAFALLAGLRALGLRYVCTADKEIDLLNAIDRTMLSITQDHQSNPFLRDQGMKTLRGMSEVVQGGFWVGRIPLGYRLTREAGAHAGKRRRSGKLEIDPRTAPVVRELFEGYAAGTSTTELADWLTDRVKPPKAKRWCASTIRQILLSPTYIGTQVFGRQARGQHVILANGEPVKKQEPKQVDNLEGSLVMRNAVPALIDEETFRLVARKLAEGRRNSLHRGASPLPLSGLGKCGSCGGTLYATVLTIAGGRKARRLVCSQRMRYGAAHCPNGTTGASHDDILEEVLRVISANLLGEDALERLVSLSEEQFGREEERRRRERESLAKESARLRSALTRAEDALLGAPDDLVENYQNAVRRAKAALQAQEERSAALDDERPAMPSETPARLRSFWAMCKAAASARIDAEGGELNDLLKELIDGFTVHFGRDKRGRVTPERVEVALPAWLSALVSSVTPT